MRARTLIFENRPGMDPGGLSEAFAAASRSLLSPASEKRPIRRPSRRVGYKEDAGTGYLHLADGIETEVFHREDYAARHVFEFTVRREGCDDAVLVTPPPRPLTAVRMTDRMARHFSRISSALTDTKAVEQDPESMAAVRRFDDLCGIAAAEAARDAYRFKAPTTPVECPGFFETLPQPFAIDREGRSLCVSPAFERLCRGTIGTLLVLRLEKGDGPPVHDLRPVTTYVGKDEPDPLDLLRTMERTRIPEGTGPLVDWRRSINGRT